MSQSQNSLYALLPRLTAEFFVIVIGVLVALGVDGWASNVADRQLETEYLGRLLDDARYDILEVDFILAASVRQGEIAAELGSIDLVETLEPALLAGSVLTVADERRPDLSRGTHRELISSGRIDLIRAAAVRVALSDYERFVNETDGAWTLFASSLRQWTLSRIPAGLVATFMEECKGDPGVSLPVREPCVFDLAGWSATQLRADLGTPEAQRELTRSGNRHRVAIVLAEQIRDRAEILQAVLESELEGR